MSEKITEERKNRLDQLFEALSIVADDTYVYLCDMRYDYSRWSKVLVEEFGLPSEYMEDAGLIWEEHVHPDDRAVYHAGIEDIFSGKSVGHDMQYRARRKNGQYDVCTCRGLVILDADGKPEYFGGAIRNHSQQRHVDTLTGLRNQYGFFEDLDSHIQNRIPMRVSIIGIGKLTDINEVFGYATGNAVLQKFGRYLMENIGNRGGTYRLDGSKFAFISQTQLQEDAREVYEDLRSHFRDGMNVGDTTVSLELNCGTIYLDEFDTDEQTVYACLNFAYDESKTIMHGDLVEFHNSLTDKNKKRVERLHAIRQSIFRNHEGFYLHYQPVVDAKTEQLIGAEALLRWKNDEYGMVPPDEFIPFLEKDPVFPALGEWILETALLGAKKILEKNRNFVLNVNLSYSQLEKTDFVDMVRSLLDRTDFPADKLCLEITERCRLLDVDLLRNVIIALRASGVRIALDDFGTGFSSMGLIKVIPFDTIKVDRGFVAQIETDELERRLVKNIKEVADIFDTAICVEGVETVEMRDILRQYGLGSFQGYLYSKPVELDKLLVMADDPSAFLR